MKHHEYNTGATTFTVRRASGGYPKSNLGRWPVLPGYSDGARKYLHVFCPHCLDWHLHGFWPTGYDEFPGWHRAGHCTKRGSRFSPGYYVFAVGELPRWVLRKDGRPRVRLTDDEIRRILEPVLDRAHLGGRQ